MKGTIEEEMLNKEYFGLLCHLLGEIVSCVFTVLILSYLHLFF
jgi:hypothetical protein